MWSSLIPPQILFLAVRMRALQISGNRGAPQGWAQNCMWMATISLTLQTCFALVSALFMRQTPTVDEDGNLKIADGGKPGEPEPHSVGGQDHVDESGPEKSEARSGRRAGPRGKRDLDGTVAGPCRGGKCDDVQVGVIWC